MTESGNPPRAPRVTGGAPGPSPVSPLRDRVMAPATPHEKYGVLFRSHNVRTLARRYGSLDRARRRWQELYETGALWGKDGLPEVYWATEPDVPDDLRPLEQPPGALGHVIWLTPEMIAGRREWLEEHADRIPRRRDEGR